MRSHLRLFTFTITTAGLIYCLSSLLITLASAQTPAQPQTPVAKPQTAETSTAPGLTASDMELVKVDWIEEMRRGGMTVVVQLVLSVGGLAVAFERLIMVRRSRFSPAGLLDQVLPLIRRGQYPEAAKLCNQKNSIMGQVTSFVIEHRNNSMESVSESVADIAGRFVVNQEQRAYPLAVVAALAPLLGLLGTMIGMIESFKLVEVFGDEGGASMLAGSISKALITTAVGLIIAIPALGLYHFLRHRIHACSMQLEQDMQALINELYMKKTPIAPASSPASAAAKPTTGKVPAESLTA